MHTQTREVALHVPRLSEDSGKGTGAGTEQLWGMHRNQGTGQAVGDLGGQRSKLEFLREVELR